LNLRHPKLQRHPKTTIRHHRNRVIRHRPSPTTRPPPPPYPQEPRPAQPPAPTTEAVLQSITRLASKIEETEKRTTEVLVPLAEKVQNLTEQVNEMKENKSIESSPLERALARMSERLDQIEDGPKRAPVSNRKPGLISCLFSD
jgi:hypothetical protein